jgi:hypothetical protein
MKTLFFAAILILVGIVGWRIDGTLSTDSIAMAVGMLFGIMAGIPTALILLASERRDMECRRPHWREEPPQRPPVQKPQIVHNHVHYHAAPGQQQRQLTGPDPYWNMTAEDYAENERIAGILRNRNRRNRREEIEERHRLPGPVAEMPASRQFRVVANIDDIVDNW